MKVFKVIGVKKVARDMIKASKAEKDFNELTENSMKRIQLDAFRRGPVLTGFLTSNLLADENRKNPAPGVWDLLDGTTYTIYQEFNNKRKPYFIRNSVDKERPRYIKAATKLAKNKYREAGFGGEIE